jgi:two-component system, OmpR family, sensor kinase
MGRLPIRIRLTLPFTVAMALVLAALGAFVYVRVGSTLLHTTDGNLFAQATEATLRIDKKRPLLPRDGGSGVSFAQVLARDGAVLESEPSGLQALLKPDQAASVAGGGSLRRTVRIAGRNGRWRVLAVPLSRNGPSSVLVLASSLGVSDESQERLRHQLFIAAPLALLLATIAGYLLAGAALRPVEEMRRKASAISAATPGNRLPVPPARDEVSRLAETLNEMLERLETAFEHERRFVADASHELRTPLALLRTELELALRHPRSPLELEEALRSAAEETDRLTALAESLLFIARAEQSALPVNPEPLAARELLTAVAERFVPLAAELGRSVEVGLIEDVAFEADPRRMEQAVGNLVDNALVHGEGTVRLSAVRRDDQIELHVVDQGSGIPAEFALQAFDRFSRADEARSRRGSGLGLSIVQAIASAHGGSAGVSGSDAWVSLPEGWAISAERRLLGSGLRQR